MFEIVARSKRFQIERLETAPFGTNAYIIICRAAQQAVLVDAPGEAKKIIQRLRKSDPKHILITHNHMDHTGALREIKHNLNISVAVHPLDAEGLPSSPEILLQHGNFVPLGRLRLKVLHTPGHTPGSLCFLIDQYLISGDTIFPGGPGKTAAPGDFKKIVESIRKKILVLPDETVVYPGHGDSTILKKEKQEFAVFSSKSHDPNLCGDVLWLAS
ncbi:MAG: MBL fold metallo-hydrolase [Candidatus Aminicenantes bacterium]